MNKEAQIEDGLITKLSDLWKIGLIQQYNC